MPFLIIFRSSYPERWLLLQAYILMKINHTADIKLEGIRNYFALYLLYMIPCPQSTATLGHWTTSSAMVTGTNLCVKRLGLGLDHPPTSSIEDKERVELYFYSHSLPSWRVAGWISLYIHQHHLPKLGLWLTNIKIRFLHEFLSNFCNIYTSNSVKVCNQ